MRNKSIIFFLITMQLFIHPLMSARPETGNFRYNQMPGQMFDRQQAEPESKFRHGEILFFLSLPFVILANTLLYTTVYNLAEPTNGFTPGALPPEFIPAIITSSIFTSGLIAYYGTKEERGPVKFSGHLQTEHYLYLGYLSRF